MQERAILKEKQARRQAAELAKAKTHSEHRFTPLSMKDRLKEITGCSLTICTSGPKTNTPEEITTRDALHERYLTPKVMARDKYLTRLRDQARGLR